LNKLRLNLGWFDLVHFKMMGVTVQMNILPKQTQMARSTTPTLLGDLEYFAPVSGVNRQ